MLVGIIGLGLMGGSIGKTLQSLPAVKKVVGFDHNISHVNQALKRSLIQKSANFSELKKCDIIILAIPVNGIITILDELKDVGSDTTIIDFGSTKAEIVNAIPSNIRKNVVAAHPMTGTEKFGPEAAVDNLYDKKVVVLCDIENSGALQSSRAVELFEQIGMRIIYMGAKEHDRHAAFISHLPHAISFSLANIVMAQEDRESILALAAGGFRDMSRLAKSSPYMWEDVFRQNRKDILEAIELFEKQLSSFKSELENSEWTNLHKSMQAATKLHDILD